MTLTKHATCNAELELQTAVWDECPVMLRHRSVTKQSLSLTTKQRDEPRTPRATNFYQMTLGIALQLNVWLSAKKTAGVILAARSPARGTRGNACLMQNNTSHGPYVVGVRVETRDRETSSACALHATLHIMYSPC